MPGPPPPPPPGGFPPQPKFVPSKSSGGPDDRSALLSSIRQGKKLKKAVTVDKSAPVIPGKVPSAPAPVSSSSSTTNVMPNGLQGLGGLFAGGMPKLKPTGKQIGGSNNNDSRTESQTQSAIPNKNFTSIQNELKRQMVSDNKNRGPPPPAPVRTNIEESLGQHFHKTASSHSLPYNSSSPNIQSIGLTVNHSTLHKKAASNLNLPTSDTIDASYNNNFPTKPVINHGKPNLAPKPPALNGKPAAPQKKLILNGGKPISRAQSMKSPRSPSPQSPDNNNPKFGTVRNLSSVLNQSLGHSVGNLSPKPRPTLNGRPSAPPPSVPNHLSSVSHSPSPATQNSQTPPSKLSVVKPPNHAPPPPPSHAPPPPPHRVNNQTLPTRAPPAIPTSAPPPPPRHSSIKDASINRRTSLSDLETRFADAFHQVHEFPKPPMFRKVLKIYSSKQESHC